jgi:hypothetical protein
VLGSVVESPQLIVKKEDLIMKLARLVGLSLVVVFAMGLLSVATASAAESSNPLFLPVNGQALTAVSGPSSLTSVLGQKITCQKDTATGNVTSSLLIGKVFVHYLECTIKSAEGGSTVCTIKSAEATGEGLILTKELHGILGLILSPAPLDTGILFLAVSGKIFVKLAEAKNGSVKCSPEVPITGTVAALITPVGVDTTKGLLVFPEATIKKIDLTHGLGLREPELVIGTSAAVLYQHDIITFAEATGIT